MTVPVSVWAAGPGFSCAGAFAFCAGGGCGVSSGGPACLSVFESGTGTGWGRCGTGCGFCISDHAINWGPRIPSPVLGAGRAASSCARLTPLNRTAIVTSIVQCFMCYLLLSCDKRRFCGRSAAIRPFTVQTDFDGLSNGLSRGLPPALRAVPTAYYATTPTVFPVERLSRG